MQSADSRGTGRALNRYRAFVVALIASCGVPLAIAYDFVSAPMFALGILIAGLIPVVIGWLIFRAGRRSAAWGWLFAIATFGGYVWASVSLWGHGSTGAISFLWVPIWNLVLVGPIGAFLGVTVSRMATSRIKRN